MTSALSVSLKNLHELLKQLADAESRKSDGPRAVAFADKQVAAAEQLIEQQKQAIKAARKSADEQNLRLKSREAEIVKLQGQLNTATSNKEFDIIKGQLATANSEKGTLEDAALGAMETIDASTRKLKELEAELQNRKQAAAAARSAMEGQLPVLQAEIERLLAEVIEAEKVIPAGDGIVTFRRLRSAHGAGALAELDDNFCSACNSRVTAQDMVRIRMGDFMYCRGCGRALYAG